MLPSNIVTCHSIRLAFHDPACRRRLSIPYRETRVCRIFAGNWFWCVEEPSVAAKPSRKHLSSLARLVFGDDKWNYKFNGDTLDGLYPMDVSETAKGQTVKDIKEFFHYYPWGVCPPELKDEVHRYRENALALAAELLVWVEDETPGDVRQLFSMPFQT